MDINVIITIAIWSILGVGIVWGIFWGVTRGILRSATRLGTLILAIVVSLIVASFLNETLLPTVEPAILDFLHSTLAGTEIGDMADAADSLVIRIIEVAAALISPILFSICFIVCALLFLIIYFIIAKFFPNKKDHPLSTTSRLVGGAISSVGAFLIAVCILMPYTGYISMAGKIYPKIQQTQLIPADAISPDVDRQLAECSENGSAAFINTMGGGLLFSWTASRDDSELSADEELEHLVETVGAVVAGVQQIIEDNTYTEDEVKPLNLVALDTKIIPAIDKDPELKSVFATVFATAALKWKAGEIFLGINLREMLGNYASAADPMLEKLSGATEENVISLMLEFSHQVTTLSHAYVYFCMVSDTLKTDADLQQKANEVFTSLDKDTAAAIKDALSHDIVGDAHITGENVDTIIGIVGDTIVDIANINDPENPEKEKAAAAINQIVSYASETRRGEMKENDMIDAMTDSAVLANRIQEIANKNADASTPEEEKKYISVSEEQKASIDKIIDEKLAGENDQSPTEEDIATLHALKALFTVSVPVEPEPPVDDGAQPVP